MARAIHLKPVRVTAQSAPASAASAASSDDETIVVATEPARSRPSSEEVVAEERAEFVAAEHAEFAGAVGEGDRQAVGVGVVGEDDVGADLPGPGEGEVERSGLLGVREGDGREIRVRIGLPFDEGRRIESRTDEELREDRTPDSVEGRVDDPQLARPVRLEDRRDRRRVGGKQRGLVEALDEGARSAPRAGLRCRAEFGGEVGDPRVVRGDHLGAVGGVGLVAVVGRRVVARGDHHAGRGTQLTHGEGGDRRGQGAGKARTRTPAAAATAATSLAKAAEPWRAS